MEALLILAVVIGVALGVGLPIWCTSRQESGKFTWAVDKAVDLSDLEKGLNHFSDEGFGIHRILSLQRGTESPGFVIIGCRTEYAFPRLTLI
jgi:hypothetical protein